MNHYYSIFSLPRKEPSLPTSLPTPKNNENSLKSLHFFFSYNFLSATHKIIRGNKNVFEGKSPFLSKNKKL
jgi:hypothetical protein